MTNKQNNAYKIAAHYIYETGMFTNGSKTNF